MPLVASGIACFVEGTRECLVPLARGLAVAGVCLEGGIDEDMSPCGGLSEPSGPSPSVCAVSVESVMLMDGCGDSDMVVRVLMSK